MEKPIDSLSDMLQANEQRGSQIIINVGTSVEGLFKQAASGIYNDVWNVFDVAKGGVINRDDGIDRVMAGEGMFLNARLHSEIMSTKFGREKFYLARQTFYFQSYGIVVPSGAAYRTIFDDILHRLIESGLILKWSQDIIAEVAAQNTAKSSSEIGESEDNDRRNKGPQAISLQNLQGAFMVMGIGFCVSAFAFVTELAIHKTYSH